MATLNATHLTMADWAKRVDPDGKTADIVEMLSQSNEVLDDMLFKEGNLPTGEQTTIRTGLPTAYYRLINAGTPDSKSTTAQVVENAAILEARSQIDEDEATLNGNVNDYRMSESEAFVEAMSQAQASTLFYGSASNPEEYVGFSSRYNDLSATNAQNIISMGGTQSVNSSIWLVGWGTRSTFGVFPKGSKAGLEHNDLGLGDAFDASNNRFRAYMDQYKWKNGLVVKDWRYNVRICNIPVAELAADPDGATYNLIENMLKAIHRVPSLTNANFCFYVNRTIKEMLDIQAMNKSNVYLKAGEEEGKPKLSLRGIPIKTVDALLETEATVA